MDAADATFGAAYEAALGQYLTAADVATNAADVQIQPLLSAYQAVVDQQQAAVNAANDAAYTALEVAWQAANGAPGAQQAAYDAYMSVVQAAVTQATAAIEAAQAAVQPSLQAAVDQVNASLAGAGSTFNSAVQGAMQVWDASEQAAWVQLQAEGYPPGQVQQMGAPLGAPQNNQPRRFGGGQLIQRIFDRWQPAPVFPPKPGDPVQVWPPVVKIFGNKPQVLWSVNGPFGGQAGVVSGSWYVGLPPVATVNSPGAFYTGPWGHLTTTVHPFSASAGVTGLKAGPSFTVKVR